MDIYVDSIAPSRRLKAQTKNRYIQSARGAILRAFKDVSVGEMTPRMIENLIIRLVDTGHLSEARNCRVVLRAMFRLAVSDNACQSNPVVVADIRLPSSGKAARALTPLELSNLRTLVAEYRTGEHVRGPKPSTALRDALDLVLGGAMRISEVLALRVIDVTPMANGRAEVRITGTIIYDKNLGAVRQDSPKSGKSRTVIVGGGFAEILRARSLASRSGLLWETPRTGKPFQQKNLLKHLRAIVRGTDLSWVTSHSLRKTSGTLIALTLGVSEATSALGHSSDAITRRIYLDNSAAAIDISQVLNGYDQQ
ncbi:tyrosine-type recombinase/integrase [Subtercola vilae]|uniref:tyrosine-type recombinase/integrase n=1 Tax=Subtercola vilae TaxID=2056433 RepID=UPI001375B5F9|nr:tyrosine-type recombinase/integrase [Subtercola vilae]